VSRAAGAEDGAGGFVLVGVVFPAMMAMPADF
jgi:hypothetical protein